MRPELAFFAAAMFFALSGIVLAVKPNPQEHQIKQYEYHAIPA